MSGRGLSMRQLMRLETLFPSRPADRDIIDAASDEIERLREEVEKEASRADYWHARWEELQPPPEVKEPTP